MSVIGIDFGNDSCFVATVKNGGVETLDNDYSLRATPSFVAFAGRKRIIGAAAKNQYGSNKENTVIGFKRLLGRKFDDPHVQHELTMIPTKIEERSDNGINICVHYLGQTHFFTPEQVTAMLLTKLKETSSQALQAQVSDCVIACPFYFTNAERQALLDAAKIAGLNVLRLLNETTAIALSYGFYKQALPSDNPRNVIFVDCGDSSLQVCACAFTKGKLKMLASSWDQVGGRDFNVVIADYFAKEFKQRYKIEIEHNSRQWLRLLSEVDKMKRQMSTNNTSLPLDIECFIGDIDVSSSMHRYQMEILCDSLLRRVEDTLNRLLIESKLPLKEIHSVEIVGGSTRIPAIKELIEKVFGLTVCTTLNQDEAVSRGGALQCAMMSPALRVRKFEITDIQNYAVEVSWSGEGSCIGSSVEIFPAFHEAPTSRLLTLSRKESFNLTVRYSQSIPYPDPTIGQWTIKEIKAKNHGEYNDIKVKVKINQHGLIVISRATLADKNDTERKSTSLQHTAIERPKLGMIEDSEKSPIPSRAKTFTDRQTNKVMDDDNDKRSSKYVNLPMEFQIHGICQKELKDLRLFEERMSANDASETKRIDAKNALEEYVYEMRSKLLGGHLDQHIFPIERDSICIELNDVENWLYEDGVDTDYDTYMDKLYLLKQRINPINARANDYERCPLAFDELERAISFARAVIADFKKGVDKYAHFTEAESINISEKIDKSQKWFDRNKARFVEAARTSDCPVNSSQIRYEADMLTNYVNSAINRSKFDRNTPKITSATITTGPSEIGQRQLQQHNKHY
uniref:Heat shock 70 kDa protein 4 n=1 Tax=Glossina palpalis gambiensis TaxID=67801 RepID=A0A1B0BH99_9MUSC